MREHKSFSVISAARTLPATAALSWLAWRSLPVSTRVCDQLVEILVVANEIRAVLESEDATPLKWIAPAIDRVVEQTDEALQRLAS
jgi:hypothetical protein